MRCRRCHASLPPFFTKKQKQKKPTTTTSTRVHLNWPPRIECIACSPPTVWRSASLSLSFSLYLSLPHSKHTTKTCSIKFQCQPKMISALLVSSTCRKNKTHSQKCCFDPLTDEKVCEIFANRTKSLSFKVRPSLGNGNGLKLRSRRIQHGQTRTRTSRRAVSALCVLNVRYTKRRLQRHIDNRKWIYHLIKNRYVVQTNKYR